MVWKIVRRDADTKDRERKDEQGDTMKSCCKILPTIILVIIIFIDNNKNKNKRNNINKIGYF